MNRNLVLSIAVCVGVPMVAGVLNGCTAQATVPTPQVQVTASAPPPPPPPPPPPAQPAGPGMVSGVGVGVAAGTGGIGSLVSPTWTATGYSPSDWVAQQMTIRARQYANGFMAVTDIVRGQMRNGERRSVVAQVVAGHCYRIIGVGGPGVSDLDLYLRDMAGNTIDRDREPDNYPVIGLQRQLCIPAGMGNQAATLEIVMFRGNGEIGVQVFGSP